MNSLSVSDIKRLLQEIPPELEEIARLVRKGLSAAMKPVMGKIAACIAAINTHDHYAKSSEDCEPVPFIWITGEEGVGKREYVQLIRAGCQYLAGTWELDCESVEQHLIQSELLGQGNDAAEVPEKPGEGKLCNADRGLLVIYEPQRLPRDCQDRLVKWQRLGQIQRGDSDGRLEDPDTVIIFVARQDPLHMTQKGELIPGLVTNSLPRIHIPPLRERPQDAVLMLEHLLRTKGRKYTGREFSIERNLEDEALFFLANFHWPGNALALREVVTDLVGSVLLIDYNHRITVSEVVASLETHYGPDVLDILAPLFGRKRRSQKRGRHKRDEVRRDELRVLRHLWNLGFHLDDLAKPLGISGSALSRRLNKAHLDPLPRGRPPKNAPPP
jgi:DNA-binding NtrC family response regulator